MIEKDPLINRITSDAEAGENNVLKLHCNYNAYLMITGAKYYAPSNFICSVLGSAYSQTANHCNNRLECAIDTTPDAFFGDPCWGFWKKLEVKGRSALESQTQL